MSSVFYAKQIIDKGKFLSGWKEESILHFDKYYSIYGNDKCIFGGVFKGYDEDARMLFEVTFSDDHKKIETELKNILLKDNEHNKTVLKKFNAVRAEYHQVKQKYKNEINALFATFERFKPTKIKKRVAEGEK